MPLTREFKQTVQARAVRDAAFREALFEEAMAALFDGEVSVGKAVLRDYVNATVGFQELGRLTSKSPKSLMRMLSDDGNPTASNLFAIVATLKQREGYEIAIHQTDEITNK